MSQENVEVVRKSNEGLESGDISAVERRRYGRSAVAGLMRVDPSSGG